MRKLRLQLLILWRRLLGQNTEKEEILLEGFKANSPEAFKRHITRALIHTAGLDLAEEGEKEADDSCLNEDQLSWKRLLNKDGLKIKKRTEV